MVPPNVPDVTSTAKEQIIESHIEEEATDKRSQASRESGHSKSRWRGQGESQMPKVVVGIPAKDGSGCRFLLYSLRTTTDRQESQASWATGGEPEERAEEAEESDQCGAKGCRATYPLYMFKPIQAKSAESERASAVSIASGDTQGARSAELERASVVSMASGDIQGRREA